jgi:hypothetical protein
VALDPAEIERAVKRRDDAEALDLDQLYSDRSRTALVRRPGDIGREYVEFARNPGARVGFGWEWLDAVLKGGIAPGEVATLAAGSYTGKTTFMANIPVNKPEIPMLFVSIEMPLILVAARIFAMSQDEEYRTLEERIKAGSANLENRIEKGLEEAVPRLGLMGVGSPSVELIGKAVESYEHQWAERPQLVMVDYLDLMAPNSENVEAVKRKFVDLRTFAKDQELGVLVAHQLKREVLEGRHGQPLRFTDTRYAGETESDHLIGLFRKVNDLAVKRNPHAMAEYRWTIHAQVLKTRSNEPAGDVEGHEMGWNPQTLRITDEPELDPIKVPPRTALDVLLQPQLEGTDGQK